MDSSAVKWLGKIGIHGGLYPKQRFAKVFDDHISITKSENDSTELYRIAKNSIKNITFHKIDFASMMLGYKGAEITYTSEGKDMTLKIYARGFGAYPDGAQDKALQETLLPWSSVSQEEAEAIKSMDNSAVNSKNTIYYIFGLTAVIFGCGWIGVLIVGFFAFLAHKVYQSDGIESKNLKLGLAIGLVLLGMFVALVVNIMIGAAIQ